LRGWPLSAAAVIAIALLVMAGAAAFRQTSDESLVARRF
jgi:hypothetical protein